MIYDEFKNFITPLTSEETFSLFDDAIDVFEQYEVPEYMSVFENTISTYAEGDQQEIIDRLLEDTRIILNQLILMQGITLTDETPLSMVISIADTLFKLPFYDDKNALKDIINTDQSDNETICTLLNLFIPTPIETLLEYVSIVDEDFISNFNEQLKTVDNSTINTENIVKHVELYIKYKKKLFSDEPCFCDHYLLQPTTIGMDFKTYLDLYQLEKQALLADATDTNISEISVDLLGMAILSRDGYTNPLIEIRKHLNTLYSDINITTKLDIQITKATVLLAQMSA